MATAASMHSMDHFILEKIGPRYERNVNEEVLFIMRFWLDSRIQTENIKINQVERNVTIDFVDINSRNVSTTTSRSSQRSYFHELITLPSNYNSEDELKVTFIDGVLVLMIPIIPKLYTSSTYRPGSRNSVSSKASEEYHRQQHLYHYQQQTTPNQQHFSSQTHQSHPSNQTSSKSKTPYVKKVNLSNVSNEIDLSTIQVSVDGNLVIVTANNGPDSSYESRHEFPVDQLDMDKMSAELDENILTLSVPYSQISNRVSTSTSSVFM